MIKTILQLIQTIALILIAFILYDLNQKTPHYLSKHRMSEILNIKDSIKQKKEIMKMPYYNIGNDVDVYVINEVEVAPVKINDEKPLKVYVTDGEINCYNY